MGKSPTHYPGSFKDMGVKSLPTERVKRPSGGFPRDGRVVVKEGPGVQWKLREERCPNRRVFNTVPNAKMMIME